MQDLCRTVKQSWGIKELCLLKSHWLVSAVINYERQTGWCSQMKQNMFGCAAQPSNDAGKQKDNCPLRWLWKSLWRDVTWRLRCASAIAKRRRIRKRKKERWKERHVMMHVSRGSFAHNTAAVPKRCTWPLTSEVRVDWKSGTGKLVVTVSRKSGSSDHRISWVGERDVSPLHLANQWQATNDASTSRHMRAWSNELQPLLWKQGEIPLAYLCGL